MDRYYLLIFNNTHGAIKAESYLKSQGVQLRIMPTPTYITHSCGISIRISDDEIEKVRDLVNKGEVEVKGIFIREGGEFRSI